MNPVEQVYEQYAPYQFLAYWYELRRSYDILFGSLIDMDPADYGKATGHQTDILDFKPSFALSACRVLCPGPHDVMHVWRPDLILRKWKGELCYCRASHAGGACQGAAQQQRCQRGCRAYDDG